MTVDLSFVEIIARLQSQIVAFRATTSVSDLLQGPMIDSLLSNDPHWISKFKSVFQTLNSLITSDPKLGCQVLIIATLLSLQRGFKLLLLKTGDWFFQPITTLSPSDDIDCNIWLKNLVFALIKSKEDRPRIIAPQLEAAGLTFADQLKLEEAAAGKEQKVEGTITGPPEEWTMTGTESEQIIKFLFTSSLLISILVKIKASHVLACLCRLSSFRPLVIQHHGVQVLIDAPKEIPIQVALARLCMTTAPHVWNYSQSISLSMACHKLIESNPYELYKFEAAIGLVNLLSFSPEVRDHIAALPTGFSACFDLLTSAIDSRVQLAGAELVCNLCLSEIACNKMSSECIKILTFLFQSSDNEQMRLTTGGALAILSQTIRLDSKPFLNMSDNSKDIKLRIDTILANSDSLNS